MSRADVMLLLANVVYGTSYVVIRFAVDAVPPATLAALRLAGGALVLCLIGRPSGPPPATRSDRWKIFWMGVLGFGAAYGLAHAGIARSTATNAALLIATEPVTLILLSPLLLGERLRRREELGAAVVIAGAVVVVTNGVPGLTTALVPHWRGDLLLVGSGIAFASYSLFGRDVLARGDVLRVTRQSVVWGLLSILPFAALEWRDGLRPAWTPLAVLAVVYLAVVVTALGYLVWNRALGQVSAPRAAIFLNVQPVVGALLGVLLLDEPVTAFTLLGGALVVAGVWVTVRSASR